MRKVVSTLENMISSEQIKLIVDDVIEEDIEEIKNESYQRSNFLIDSNDNLILENIPNIDQFKNIGSSNQKYIQSGSVMMDREKNSSNAIIQVKNSSRDSFVSTFNNINHPNVNQLITKIIKIHDEGITFNQVHQLINQKILQFNQDADKLINWLMKNQNISQYIWFLGLFYYYSIDTEENSAKAFELFSKASKENYPIALVYLAKCYNDGYGTERNKPFAFDLYQESAKNGSIIGQFYLGYCYEYGIGTENDEKQSFHWYKAAAKNGNITAKLYLAECYRLGKGVEKNKIKAFKYYRTLADEEIVEAQFQLGNCFYHGIGAKLDRIQACCWYEKAATNGDVVAQFLLKKYFNRKIKDETKITNKVTKFKVLNQLRLYCIGKILIKTNYEKAFYYFQKASENGYKVAQHNLGVCYRDGISVSKNERKAFELFNKSAAQGYIDGKFQLGYCYDHGIGTEINKTKAFELYKEVAEKGYEEAKKSLDILLKQKYIKN